MSRKRSRPNTEARFQEAVLEIVAESGCEKLGINAVAIKAGADKVLIYRYFGNLNGLLTTVAERQKWLPPIDELIPTKQSSPLNCADYLKALFDRIVGHLRSVTTTHQLIRWRNAVRNPLTDHLSAEWSAFWKALPTRITRHSGQAAQTAWLHACSLIALLVEAELNDEVVASNSIQLFATNLPAPEVDA